MAGLELLLGALLFGGSAISAGIENAKMMSKPYRYLDDGTPVYLDRLCNEHINGEKVVSKYNYQLKREQQVGERSGKVYFDAEELNLQRERKQDEEELKRSKRFGYLAYYKYHPEYEKRLATEISTGKIIAVLMKDAGEYRKFYYNDRCPSFSQSAPGDFGVIISKDEFYHLSIIDRTYGNIPDWDVWHQIIDKHKKNKEREIISE